MKKTRKHAKSGSLRIGNQWNAINIIARSQTHPLKAVCELVENSIDAKSTTVHILRRRRQGRVYLEILDDGEGLPLDDEGHPQHRHRREAPKVSLGGTA